MLAARKVLSIALIIGGLFLLVFGLISFRFLYSIIGLVIGFIGVGLLIPAMLKGEEVIDNWSVLIEEGRGGAEKVFKDTEGFIRESKAPGLKIERQKLAPGVLKGIFGVKRDFLVVTNLDNPKLEPFKVYINARDYGNNLDVSWYLTYKPKAFRFRGFNPALTVGKMDLFDQQDLRAYVTNAHHCLLKAVEELMVGLGQDTSKLERKSRGFLGIS